MKLFYLLITPLLFVACAGDGDDIEPDNPIEGSSTITVTGIISSTTTDNGAEFVHTISSVTAGEFSGLTVTMGNIGTTETALQLTIGDFGNGSGIEEKSYIYDTDPDATEIMTAVYATDTDFFTHNSDSNDAASVTISKVTDNSVEGTFDLNLENFDGEKLNIKGSFIASGETLRS